MKGEGVLFRRFDRWGRRRPLKFGVSLGVIASILSVTLAYIRQLPVDWTGSLILGLAFGAVVTISTWLGARLIDGRLNDRPGDLG